MKKTILWSLLLFFTTTSIFAQDPYTDGVFFVNEDNFPANGTVNFLDDAGLWHYRIYQNENPGKKLGVTSQFGAIYGDKFFIVSKQSARLVVCNPATMESLAEFTDIGTDDADGRSFLGVDEHKGYIGTSDGIYVFDMDNLTIGQKVKGTANPIKGELYTGQIGTMLRTADKVFAVHQEKGLLVIDIKGDSVQTIINAPKDGSNQRGFGSIVQSKDGNLWLSIVEDNYNSFASPEDYMIKLNPYTLDTTRIVLPAGMGIPNSWGAWTADGFCASTQNNKLYWQNNGGWFYPTNTIYEYDIDNNQTRTVVDLSSYDGGDWEIYGAGFRLDPRTDDIYASLAGSWGMPPYQVAKISTDGIVTETYPMIYHYWFPAMPVFTDKYEPIVSVELTDVSTNEEVKIYLGDKVSDEDNLAAAIVKSIISISNETILTAQIRNDSLIISPVAEQSGISNIELQFNSNGKIVTKTIKVTIPPPTVLVTSVELNPKTKTLKTGQTLQAVATVLPVEATNKNVTWLSLDETIATVNTTGLVTAIAEGLTKIVVTTVDQALTDTLELTVEQMLYTDGVFFVNEDLSNGTVNFLDDEGFWHYRIYQNANPGKKLGVTSQFGAIYGDKFFIVSKQSTRLAVCNSATMQSLAEITDIGSNDAEGHSFLGVDEHKGYIGTSDGIYVFDMDNLTVGQKVKGTANITGSPYTGQIGTMLRTADKVFAVHQEKGLLVIDIKGDSVQTIINAPKDGSNQRGFGSIVQSKDGNLWLSIATDDSGMSGAEDYMLKLNPYTLDTTRIVLPAGTGIPNSWYAWTADGFCAGTQNNKLYWQNNGGWVFPTNTIYEYDIDNNQTRTVVDLSSYDGGDWEIYGAGFRLDPRTDDIYVSLAGSWGMPPYQVAKISTDGTITETYPMEDYYWFPAMPVFTDKYEPVVSVELTDVSTNEEVKIYLGDKVSDEDNLAAAIVKSIISISNETILTAQIRNDSLIISPVAGQSGISNIELQFNSNGKIVTATITVTVTDGVGIDSHEKQLCKIYPTVTTGLIHVVLPEMTTESVQIIDMLGKVLQNIRLESLETTVDISSYQAGLYMIKTGNQTVKVIKQ